MTTLTLELPSEMYHWLHTEADRLGKSPQIVAREWLLERLVRLTRVSGSEREQARQALRRAGLLAELGDSLRARATLDVRLGDVEAALARAGGKPLSEIVLEQRGPKE